MLLADASIFIWFAVAMAIGFAIAFALAAVCVLAAGLFAAWLPARQAAAVDPNQTLRGEA